MKRFVAPIVVLLLAVALAATEYRVAKNPRAAEFDRVLEPHEYTSDFTTELLPTGSVDTRKRIRVSAPLKNAWMHITATVLRADGTEVATSRLYIDYFWRPQRVVRWTWGLQETSVLMTVAPEKYRLRLKIALEPENATPPPLRVQVLPPVTGSPVRLLGCAVMTTLGLGLLLRQLAPSRGVAPPPLRPGPDAADVPARSDEPFPSGRLHFIDGLRGIAAMTVLLCHLFVPAFSPSVHLIEEAIGPEVPDAMRAGAVGVEIFFVLSGFVIAYSIRRYRVSPGFILRFIARRFLRLDPPYYGALLLAIVVMALSMPDSLHTTLQYFQTGKGLIINALYLHDLLGYRSPFGTVAWTLCLEVQFYLALVTLTGVSQWMGAIFRAPETRAVATRVTWWLLLGSLAVMSFATWHPSHGDFSFMGAWFRFFIGVATFRCLAARSSPWPLGGLLVLLMVFCIVYSDARGFTAAATAALILTAGKRGALGRWLSGRFWQFLGRISYSLYIYHTVLALPLAAYAWSYLPHNPTFAALMIPLGMGIAVGSGWAMYAWIERPSVALSHRVRYRQ